MTCIHALFPATSPCAALVALRSFALLLSAIAVLSSSSTASIDMSDSEKEDIISGPSRPNPSNSIIDLEQEQAYDEEDESKEPVNVGKPADMGAKSGVAPEGRVSLAIGSRISCSARQSQADIPMRTIVLTGRR